MLWLSLAPEVVIYGEMAVLLSFWCSHPDILYVNSPHALLGAMPA